MFQLIMILLVSLTRSSVFKKMCLLTGSTEMTIKDDFDFFLKIIRFLKRSLLFLLVMGRVKYYNRSGTMFLLLFLPLNIQLE